MDYQQFINSKKIVAPTAGISIPLGDLSPELFDFQRDIVRWALRKGKAAIFAGCGLGKSPIQLIWSDVICKYTSENVLILAPLAVSQQTVREGEKFKVKINLCREQVDVRPGINITNYEILHKFDINAFTGVVLDESGILKSFSGKTRNAIIDSFKNTPFKLACTATPAPNDHMELGNHAEFLGVMNYNEMLAMFFTHDGSDTSKWRLKGHAVNRFWEWVASWAVMLQKPSDLGYEDNGFILPPLRYHQHTVKSNNIPEGSLFAVEARTLQEQLVARRESISDRVAKCVDLVSQSNDEQLLIWCNLNTESESLSKSLSGSTEVKGSNTPEQKEKAIVDFCSGNTNILISKPSIFGFGLNLQQCNKIVFVGLSNSFEEFYQAVRRCWRFGQTKPVDVHVITADTEGAVVANIERKERDFETMLHGMIAATSEIAKENIKSTTRDVIEYKTGIEYGDNWEMRLGDCVEVIKDIADNSIHYSLFSPPFASLYCYSNSSLDMGNSKNEDEFLQHFIFLIRELYRVIMPGRLLSFHCMNLPTMKQNHGYIGLSDFRGSLIRVFLKAGFIFHSEVCIWKDPVIAAVRTKALGLLWKQIKKDSSMSRQGIPDYLVTMRKPGENPERISHTSQEFPVDLWQRYASPIWMDINQTNTLKRESAREADDERHICPLQLDVIERALKIWTNPGDVVLSPFAGIGSEGYGALRFNRRFIGIELKKSYFDVAVKNLKRAECVDAQITLLDLIQEENVNAN